MEKIQPVFIIVRVKYTNLVDIILWLEKKGFLKIYIFNFQKKIKISR